MLFLRFLIILAFLQVAAIRCAIANPMVFECGEPIALIAENVDIAVQEGQSVVSGTYSFRRVEGCPYAAGEPITIKVPVILHEPQSLASLRSATTASLRLGRQVLHPSRTFSVEPLYDLPSGWNLYYLEFEIPRPPLHSVFTIAVRYVQPHLPGRVAPYYPIRPPERWAPESVVRYTVAEPASLTLLSRRDKIVEAQPTRISVQPQHHKLILVRVKKL